MKSIVFIFLLFSAELFCAYYDQDIDGVEDRLDQCTNTPFDVLVDKFGCDENGNNGKFTLKVGTDIGFDSFSQRVSTYNFLLHYETNNWTIGVSNSNYIGYDDFNTSVSETGDIYMNLDYVFYNDAFTSQLGLGMKIATAKTSVGTGENDYYLSTQLSTNTYQQSYKFFTNFIYTFTGDTSILEYKDVFSYSAGVNYKVNEDYHISLYYENSQSIYKDAENYEALVWSNYYQYKDNYFVELDYIRGIDTFSYSHMLAIKVGVTFE